MFRRKMPDLKTGDIIKYNEDTTVDRYDYLMVIVSDVRGLLGYPIFECNGKVQMGTKWVDIDPEAIVELYQCGDTPFDQGTIHKIISDTMEYDWSAYLFVTYDEVCKRFGGRIKLVNEDTYRKLEEVYK